MWASSGSSRVIVTSQVEWTGRSFIKAGLIEKSAMEGQRTYQRELERAMRDYIQEHPTEFTPGLDPAAVTVALQGPAGSITPMASLPSTSLSEEVGRRKEMHRTEENWVQEIVTALWEKLAPERQSDVASPSPAHAPVKGALHASAHTPASAHLPESWGEVAELSRALDAVEERVRLIRQRLAGLDQQV